MKVYPAYYHTGFVDDGKDLLNTCESRVVAEAVIDYHKANRDKEIEFKGRATWWVQDRDVLTAIEWYERKQ